MIKYWFYWFSISSNIFNNKGKNPNFTKLKTLKIAADVFQLYSVKI